MKMFWLFFSILLLTSCSFVNKQFYYVTNTKQKTTKYRARHANRISVPLNLVNETNDSIGKIQIENNAGKSISMGLPYLPVIPTFFYSSSYNNNFLLYLSIIINKENDKKYKLDSCLNLCDSNSIKNGNSLYKPYIIINNNLKIPIAFSRTYNNYYLQKNNFAYAIIPLQKLKFRNVKTFKLFTGNTIMDSSLSNIVFKRKSRLNLDFIGCF